MWASVSGGERGAATDDSGSISGGCSNLTGTGTNPYAQANCEPGVVPGVNSVSGGANNTARGSADAILGGANNTALAFDSAILGGTPNTVNTNCGTFPATGQSC